MLISYAQNSEDLMLWRAFGYLRHGFYIDVGAGDPEEISVTRLFYERGWHGINVEPQEAHFARLSALRTRDINLRIGLSDSNSQHEFFLIKDNADLATFREDIGEMHKAAGHQVEKTRIRTTTLADVCHQYAADTDIHFLKIDVEGTEGAVLAGADFSRFRPWIIVVEATVPNSTVESFSDWEPLLLQHNYRFAWFDGLNRFYIAREHCAVLHRHFRAPPNVFDGFMRAADLLKQFDEMHQALATAREQNVVEARRAAEAIASQEAAVATCEAAIAAAVHEAEQAGRRAAVAEAGVDGQAAISREAADRAAGQRKGGRVLLDLSTSLAWRGRHAVGIVRTEREVAVRLLDRSAMSILPVIFRDGALRALEPDIARAIVAPISATLAKPASEERAPPPHSIQPPAAKKSLLTRVIAPIAYVLRVVVRLTLNAVPVASREEVRLALIHARQAVRNLIYKQHLIVAANPEAPETPLDPNLIGPTELPLDLSLIVHPKNNDVLLCCGLGWDVMDWGLIEALRGQWGLRLVCVVYDLIPIKFPEMLGQPIDHYLDYFLRILDNCTLALCISKCTHIDLAEFAVKSGRREPAAEVVRLGADTPAAATAEEFADLALKDRLARGRFALTVGTFEIRKNFRLLIDLWHELVVDDAFDLDLVIVGMRGWCVEDVIEKLIASPLFGVRIFWLQGISDSGLSWLYETCHVFLFPSLYEGWGLPVVEALQHGRPVIASNRGAIPEAGFGAVDIIDPDDRGEWRRAITIAAHSPRKHVTVAEVPNWDLTAESIQQHLSNVLWQKEKLG
jgi:FkbM family methyltransferase